jgi:hypothetical protein
MRFGFIQAGKAPGLTSNFFLSSRGYFNQLNAGASIEQQWATKTTSMFLQIFKNPIKQQLVGIDKELFDLVM